jgi:hypothetical protein
MAASTYTQVLAAANIELERAVVDLHCQLALLAAAAPVPSAPVGSGEGPEVAVSAPAPHETVVPHGRSGAGSALNGHDADSVGVGQGPWQGGSQAPVPGGEGESRSDGGMQARKASQAPRIELAQLPAATPKLTAMNQWATATSEEPNKARTPFPH